jgi:hypothetical protein
MTRIPKSIASSEIQLFGVTLHCHVLDNGQRIIDAADIEKLFEAMEIDGSREAQSEAMEALARFCRGVPSGRPQ